MDKRASIATVLSELDELSPGGFAIALHIKYNAPTFLFQTFPEKWVKHYSRQGFVIRDPAVHWAFSNTGYIRWRDLVEGDTSGVMEQSRLFGLTYGFTASIHNDHSRTLAGFARPDRDYLDVEIDGKDIKSQLMFLLRLIFIKIDTYELKDEIYSFMTDLAYDHNKNISGNNKYITPEWDQLLQDCLDDIFYDL